MIPAFAFTLVGAIAAAVGILLIFSVEMDLAAGGALMLYGLMFIGVAQVIISLVRMARETEKALNSIQKGCGPDMFPVSICVPDSRL